MDKEKIYRKTKEGLEEIQGYIYKGFAIYKGDRNRWYLLATAGDNKGIALWDGKTFKRIKESVDELESLKITSEMVNDNAYSVDIRNQIADLRNKYWLEY